MSVYLKNAGPTLSGLLSKAAELAHRRISLEEEVDLARSLVMRACEYWSLALDHQNASDELRMQCERVVRDAIDTVTKTVVAAAKVRLMDQGAIQLSSVQWVMAEVTKAIEEEIRDQSPEMADALVGRIGKIKLPEDGTLQKFLGSAVANEEFL